MRYTPLVPATALRYIPGSGTGCGGNGENRAWGQGARRGGPRAGAQGIWLSMRWGTGYSMYGPATMRSFLGFRLFNHPPALRVTEPRSSQVAWSQWMSSCRALLMVPHVLPWVVSSWLGHPVWMRGILAFARAELVMLGGGMPLAPVACLPTG